MNRRPKQLAGLVLAAVMAVLLIPVRAFAAPLEITQQPQDVEVAYPDGGSFHVEVSDPEQVASYQWIISDTNSDFYPVGTSAASDTFVVVSTEQDTPDLYMRCLITAKDGSTVESEEAVLHVTNKDEDKTVFYIGENAVEPGETFDLADAATGSGTVTFDADGTTVTLDSVQFSTDPCVYDMQLAPCLGIFLMRRNGGVTTYTINLVGDNTITDTYFDADYNSAGIVFNSYFAATDDPNPPTLRIQGEGSLELNGGSRGIYSDSNIEIDAAVSTQPNGDIYLDAITGRNIIIGEHARLDLACNGTAIRAKGGLVIADGAVVTAMSTAPHVSVGATAKSVINVDESIEMGAAEVTVHGHADPDQFVPYGTVLGNYVGVSFFGDLAIDGGALTVVMDEDQVDEAFVMSCYGISGDGDSSAVRLTGGAKVSVEVDMPDVLFAGGILPNGDLVVEEGSAAKIVATSSGETGGVEAGGRISLADGVLDSQVTSTETAHTYGIVCGGIDISFSTGSEGCLRSVAENGIALAADTGEHGEFAVEPVDGYAPQAIVLNGAAITTPATSEINLFGVPGYGETIKAETVFDAQDRTDPATEVLIAAGEGAPAPSPEPAPAPAPTPDSGGGAGMIVGICCIVAVLAAVVIAYARSRSRK